MLPFQLSAAEFDTVKIERKRHPQAKIRTRLDVLYFLHLDHSRGGAAQLADCSPNSVTNYIKLFNAGGLAAVTAWNYVFERHELRDRFDEVATALERTGVRDVAQARELLAEDFDYRRGAEAARLLLHRLGFRRLKRGTFPGKPKDLEVWLEAQRRFKKHLKKLRKRANKGRIDLGFGDAAHFVYGKFDAYRWGRGPCYAPSGHGRHRLNVYGLYDAVSGTICSMYNEGYVDAAFMTDYLNWLREKHYTDRDRPLHVVIDNARYQHCALVKRTAEGLNIVLEFLPPYSPNLNLIERLWKYLKKQLADQYCADKHQFKQCVVNLLRELNLEKHEKKLKSLLTFKFQQYQKSQILLG